MYTPIDAINHGYNYETLKVEIPHQRFIIYDDWTDEEQDYDNVLLDMWQREIENTVRNLLNPRTFQIEDMGYIATNKLEKAIVNSKLVQIRTTSLPDHFIIVIRETPRHKQYIHNLSGVHVNRIAKLLKAKLAQEGYQVS